MSLTYGDNSVAVTAKTGRILIVGDSIIYSWAQYLPRVLPWPMRGINPSFGMFSAGVTVGCDSGLGAVPGITASYGTLGTPADGSMWIGGSRAFTFTFTTGQTTPGYTYPTQYRILDSFPCTVGQINTFDALSPTLKARIIYYQHPNGKNGVRICTTRNGGVGGYYPNQNVFSLNTQGAAGLQTVEYAVPIDPKRSNNSAAELIIQSTASTNSGEQLIIQDVLWYDPAVTGYTLTSIATGGFWLEDFLNTGNLGRPKAFTDDAAYQAWWNAMGGFDVVILAACWNGNQTTADIGRLIAKYRQFNPACKFIVCSYYRTGETNIAFSAVPTAICPLYDINRAGSLTWTAATKTLSSAFADFPGPYLPNSDFAYVTGSGITEGWYRIVSGNGSTSITLTGSVAAGNVSGVSVNSIGRIAADDIAGTTGNWCATFASSIEALADSTPGVLIVRLREGCGSFASAIVNINKSDGIHPSNEVAKLHVAGVFAAAMEEALVDTGRVITSAGAFRKD